MINLVSFGWIVSILLLFLYSFTQIDLGLTLTRVSWWQGIQKNFQLIGYFNRPLSTGFYLGILLLLFVFYVLLLWLAKKDRLLPKNLWWLIGLTALVLLFSYPAFSHDIFNYIFDAKTVVVYHKSPYEVKPLDFPGDPMLGFMHWTHRPSIFPPFWIGLSIFPFVLGFGKFILQLFWFKAMMTVFYLGTIWLIDKILRVLNVKNPIFHLAFYALNPLILVESLVSGHYDGVMIFFALLAFYLLLKKKYCNSFLFWFFSIGLKYVSAVLLPIFLLGLMKKIKERYLIELAIILMFLAIFVVTYWYLGFQPWYLLWVLPFIALREKGQLLVWLMISFSLGSLLRYAPFLYYGYWDSPVPTIKIWLTSASLGLGFLAYVIKKYAPK